MNLCRHCLCSKCGNEKCINGCGIHCTSEHDIRILDCTEFIEYPKENSVKCNGVYSEAIDGDTKEEVRKITNPLEDEDDVFPDYTDDWDFYEDDHDI